MMLTAAVNLSLLTCPFPLPSARRVGFSVRGADGSWQQVPICYPMRCAGLWAVSGSRGVG